MKIHLVRHGKSEIEYPEKIYANQMSNIISAYDRATIDKSNHPPYELLTALGSINYIVCSDLQRSIDSVAKLGLTPNLISPLFREAELSYPDKAFFALSPYFWSTILRIVWFFGYSNHSETFQDAKKRAHRASLKLINLANENEEVLLVGHGFINRFISRVLKLKGWQGPPYSGKNFWSHASYRRPDDFSLKNSICG